MTFSEMNWLDRILFLKRLKTKSGIEKTVTGNPIHVTDALSAKVKSLSVALEPIQDLHGQDAPYPAGGGKNKLPITLTSSTYYGLTVTVDDKDGIKLTGTTDSTGLLTLYSGDLPSGITPGESYIFSWESAVSTMRLFAYNASNVRTVLANSGSATSVNVTIPSDAVRLSADINVSVSGTTYNVTVKPMIRLASVSDATFAPYENICPISGRDSVTVERTGENLFDKSAAVVGKWLNVSTGAEENISTNYALSDWIPVKSSTTYSFTNPQSSRRWFYDASKNPVSAISGSPFTPEQDGFIRITIAINTVSLDTFMVVIGNTLPSSYAPYDGQSATIALGQTVYGGTVDVTTGVLTVEWENIASYDGEALPGEWISDRDAYAPGTTPTTGAQVCYKLATPITIDLTSAQLSTLKGTNTVWSDGDSVEMTYKAVSS